MQVLRASSDLRQALATSPQWALVPTMGNLHEGHLTLIRLARKRLPVVVSLFVNPLQFGPNEDFDTYPRTLDRDCEVLRAGGCEIVFAPNVREMYPDPSPFTVSPPVALGDVLEGECRPGFFAGVCTIVLKLLAIVRPAVAVFGKKDYQQLLVIRRMAQDFGLPVEIIAAETVRESDGLACSSRNQYLTQAQRSQAPELYRHLLSVASRLQAGRSDWRALEIEASHSLTARGWHPDYIAIRRRDTLGEPTPQAPLVVLAAARLGATRLLDNIEVL